MKARTITLHRTISLDVEIVVEVHPAHPGRGESGYSLGEPAEPAYGEILAISTPLGSDLTKVLDELDRAEREDIEADAVSAATEAEIDALEYAAEMRADEARDDRLTREG